MSYSSTGHKVDRLYSDSTVASNTTQECPGDLSEFGASMNLLKFVIGLGIISLPEATKHVGWLPSIIGLAGVGLVTVAGIFFALKSREEMDRLEQAEKEQTSTRAMTEGDPLNDKGSWRDVPDTGCGFFEKIVGKVWGRTAQYVFAASIVLGQFTTLVIYLNVICTNFESYWPQNQAKDYHIQILVGVTVVLGLFSLIPTLQGIAWLSAAGLSIYTFLFIAIIHSFIEKAHEGTLSKTAYMVVSPTPSNYGEWFGVSCFAFSAFPISMNIYEEMQDRSRFQPVVSWSFVAIWIVYSAFALLGFLCYGEKSEFLIYFNFAEGSQYRDAAAGSLACVLCFSFVVQAMPVFTWTAKALESSHCALRLGFTGGAPMIAVRWTVLALTVTTAVLIPSTAVMMNTMGAVSGVLAGFVIPAATLMKVSSRDKFRDILCVLVIIIGILGAYYSCTAPVKESVSHKNR